MITISYSGGDRIKISVRPGEDDLRDGDYLTPYEIGRTASDFLSSDECPAIKDLDYKREDGVIGVWRSNIRYFENIKRAMERISENVIVTQKMGENRGRFEEKCDRLAKVKLGKFRQWKLIDFDGKLYSPFQDAGCYFLYNVERGLLADDMGLGKTVQSLNAAVRLMIENKVSRCLVLCPTSVALQWAGEIQKFFPGYTVAVSQGSSDERREIYGDRSIEFVISNYEKMVITTRKEIWIPVPLSFFEGEKIARVRQDCVNLGAEKRDVRHWSHEHCMDFLRSQSNIGIPYKKRRKDRVVQVLRMRSTDDFVDQKYVKNGGFDLLILDEVQRAKNSGTKTARACYSLAHSMRYVFALSGTPIENRLMELHSIASVIDPTIFGSESRFKSRYLRKGYGGGESVLRVGEVRAILNTMMLRREKREVYKELPPVVREEKLLDLLPVQRRMYDAVRDEVLEALLEWENASKRDKPKARMHTFAKIMYLRQICNSTEGWTKEGDGEGVKVYEFVDLIREMNDKVVVFSQWVWMINALDRELEKVRIKPLIITGSTDKECKASKESLKSRSFSGVVSCGECKYFDQCSCRLKIQYQFNNDSIHRVLLSSEAMKFGANLQRAPYMIHVDEAWNPATMRQREGRIDRIGQEASKVVIVTLTTRDTIEERVKQVLKRKEKLFRDVIDEAALMSKLSPREWMSVV
jgi:SNF2 family DNA or RNA helicase